MLGENLVQLRKYHQMTQEDVAEKIGVSRQAVAKWENGKTFPDLLSGQKLARLFGVSLEDLIEFEPERSIGLPVPPKGKHLFGLVTVGEKGQIIIPARARKIFGIAAGDRLIVLGDERQGLAIIKADDFLAFADQIRGQADI